MPVTKPMQVVISVAAIATIAVAAMLSQPGLKPQPAPVPATPALPAADPASTIRFGVKQAPAKTSGAIRITTFNVENLFDDKDDPKLSGTFEDKDSTKPADQLKAAADA
ncbi:MAG: hypothetical protein Q8L55_01505, partial [Phycisphaerales bacterium]|nr:hypothetical protein [Phycisphaerales bacterium]